MIDLIASFGFLIGVAVLSLRAGYDSRERLRSGEEEFARYGFVWESGPLQQDEQPGRPFQRAG